jgi:tRNA(Ile)-lysidine synthase
VAFCSLRLNANPAKGQSVEAWARTARYAALRSMAEEQGASVVLLAHHQRDQAETFILQALRGAGVDGLSGMPASVNRHGITWQRPWLDKPRAAIDAYVRRHRLRHIEDDSNADARFARNRLRLDVWPSLVAAFDQADSSLATSAQWAQEASAALEELATIDAQTVVTTAALRVADWLALSTARRSNLLRAWLRAQTEASAPASLVRRLLDELPASKAARWPTTGGELRLHRGILRFQSSPDEALKTAMVNETALKIRGPGTYELPGWSGVLRVERAAEIGVPLAWLAHLELRPRVGSEQFQAGIGRPPRSLKKQYQASGIAMWDRGGPLVYSGGQLIFVPGLGLDARVVGLPGQELMTLQWLPRARSA